MENKLQEFNSRSDFKLKVNLLNNGNVINPRDLKWTIAHYIVTSKKVIASYDGTTLTNCELNGNDIICVFDNHNLGVGRLMREVILYIEDDAMPDGIRKEVKVSTTNYRLTNTPCTKCEPVEITDSIDFSVTGTPGKDAYEVWLTLPGNAGKTKEEFFDSFKGSRPAIDNARILIVRSRSRKTIPIDQLDDKLLEIGEQIGGVEIPATSDKIEEMTNDVKEGKQTIVTDFTNLECFKENQHFKAHQWVEGKCYQGLISNYGFMSGPYTNTSFYDNQWLERVKNVSELK